MEEDMEKKVKKFRCLSDIKKYSFPHHTIVIWNDLREEVVTAKSAHMFKVVTALSVHMFKVVTAKSVHMFKEKLDKYGYGDRTI